MVIDMKMNEGKKRETAAQTAGANFSQQKDHAEEVMLNRFFQNKI